MEELIIPLRISGDQAVGLLDQLKARGGEAGAEIRKGAEKATEGHDALASALRRVHLESMALSAGRQALDALAQGAVQASERLRRMAEDFINLRDRARELAGVLGQPGNVQFTQDQLSFAVQTGFADPGKAVDFRTAFQGEASQYKGRFASADEFTGFEREAARLGNQNNVPPEVMARIAGMVIRTGAKEGQTSQGAMQRLGGAFKTMMAGSGGIGELAGQLARMSGLVGEDNAFRNVAEAATATRMAAETNLPEAYTWQTEMRTGVIEMATDEKNQEQAQALGITAATTNFEAIKKLSAAQERSGKNMDVFLAGIFPLKRIRDAYRDAIKAYRNNVMTQGLKDATAVQPGQIEAESAAYFADPEQAGMLAVEQARTREREGLLGQDRATIAPYLQRAKTDLAGVEADPFARTWHSVLDATTGWGRGLMGMGYRGFEQLETARAMGQLRTEAEALGIDTSGAPSVATAPQREVERYMAELVRLTREANQQRDKTAQKPLSAPPPAPSTRP